MQMEPCEPTEEQAAALRANARRLYKGPGEPALFVNGPLDGMTLPVKDVGRGIIQFVVDSQTCVWYECEIPGAFRFDRAERSKPWDSYYAGVGRGRHGR